MLSVDRTTSASSACKQTQNSNYYANNTKTTTVATTAASTTAAVENITPAIDEFLDLATDAASILTGGQVSTEDKIMFLTKLKKAMSQIVEKVKKALPEDIANATENSVTNALSPVGNQGDNLNVLKENCIMNAESIIAKLVNISSITIEKYAANINDNAGSSLGAKQNSQATNSVSDNAGYTNTFANLPVIAIVGMVFEFLSTSTKAAAEYQIRLSNEGQAAGKLASDFMGLLSNLSEIFTDIKNYYAGNTTINPNAATDWGTGAGFSINSYTGSGARTAADDAMAGVFTCFGGNASPTGTTPPPDMEEVLNQCMPNDTIASCIMQNWTKLGLSFPVTSPPPASVIYTSMPDLINALNKGDPYADAIFGTSPYSSVLTPLFDSGNGSPLMPTTSGIWVKDISPGMAKLLGGITVGGGYTLVTKNLLDNACLAVSQQLHQFNANYPSAIGEGGTSGSSSVNGGEGTLYTAFNGLTHVDSLTLPGIISNTISPLSTNTASQIQNLEQHISTLLSQIMEFLQQVAFPEVQQYQKCSSSISNG